MSPSNVTNFTQVTTDSSTILALSVVRFEHVPSPQFDLGLAVRYDAAGRWRTLVIKKVHGPFRPCLTCLQIYTKSVVPHSHREHETVVPSSSTRRIPSRPPADMEQPYYLAELSSAATIDMMLSVVPTPAPHSETAAVYQRSMHNFPPTSVVDKTPRTRIANITMDTTYLFVEIEGVLRLGERQSLDACVGTQVRYSMPAQLPYDVRVLGASVMKKMCAVCFTRMREFPRLFRQLPEIRPAGWGPPPILQNALGARPINTSSVTSTGAPADIVSPLAGPIIARTITNSIAVARVGLPGETQNTFQEQRTTHAGDNFTNIDKNKSLRSFHPTNDVEADPNGGRAWFFRNPANGSWKNGKYVPTPGLPPSAFKWQAARDGPDGNKVMHPIDDMHGCTKTRFVQDN